MKSGSRLTEDEAANGTTKTIAIGTSNLDSTSALAIRESSFKARGRKYYKDRLQQYTENAGNQYAIGTLYPTNSGIAYATDQHTPKKVGAPLLSDLQVLH